MYGQYGIARYVIVGRDLRFTLYYVIIPTFVGNFRPVKLHISTALLFQLAKLVPLSCCCWFFSFSSVRSAELDVKVTR